MQSCSTRLERGQKRRKPKGLESVITRWTIKSSKAKILSSKTKNKSSNSLSKPHKKGTRRPQRNKVQSAAIRKQLRQTRLRKASQKFKSRLRKLWPKASNTPLSPVYIIAAKSLQCEPQCKRDSREMREATVNAQNKAVLTIWNKVIGRAEANLQLKSSS